MRLIIVESPTKSKTLQSFLGKEYKILSSFGHVRDLPKSTLGIDTEKNFDPQYVIPTKARKLVNELKKEALKADSVTLATDEDREGEAIAWHLATVLNLQDPQRIVFHEITKSAIEEALKNPRTVDINRVNAQQARRILDRLVGYKLSPFLWKKVARNLSAGRVQSVAVRLIADREKEIQAFVPQEYWSITALLGKQTFTATLVKRDRKPVAKLDIKKKEEADAILKDLKHAEYIIEEVLKKEMQRNPFPPFTTSTLQQESWKQLRYPAKFTMSLAQQLYETGLITYHRTDSLHLSESSTFAAKDFIIQTYGKEYWPGFVRVFKNKIKGAQEAHEAIRPAFAEATAGKPTFINQVPEALQSKLHPRSWKLYDLIWKRFIASQMQPALFDSTSVDITAKNYGFRATGQILKFPGYVKVYPMKFEESELPVLAKGDVLELKDLISSQHFTEPAPRYTEATLVKALEEHEVGRPSTYAPIISTIQDRGYIEKNEQRRFKPTDLGVAVNDLLVKHFPEIVDMEFTAGMEEKLDEIAKGEKQWVPMLQEFYQPFEKNLEKKYEEVQKKDMLEQITDKKCLLCGSPLVVRFGRFGKFLACSTFPACKHTEPIEKKEVLLGVACPTCKEGQITAKRTKRGKIFYSCNKYPNCKFALWNKPTGATCEQCNSLMVGIGKDKTKCSKKECATNAKLH